MVEDFIESERTTEWSMMISAFFDESGKFKDQSTIAFAGVVGAPQDFREFNSE